MLIALDNAWTDKAFDLLSRCAYIFAVVEKLECPNHSCIDFIGIPLASNKLAQECLKSWKWICFNPLLFSNILKCCVT